MTSTSKLSTAAGVTMVGGFALAIAANVWIGVHSKGDIPVSSLDGRVLLVGVSSLGLGVLAVVTGFVLFAAARSGRRRGGDHAARLRDDQLGVNVHEADGQEHVLDNPADAAPKPSAPGGMRSL